MFLIEGLVLVSAEEGHGGLDTRGKIVLPPVGGDSLALSVETNSILSVEVVGTDEGLLGASEGEERQGDGDGQVDSDLAGVDLVLELAGNGTGRGEDGSSVSVGVGVDDLEGLIEGLGRHDAEDGTEDLLLVDAHVLGDASEDGGTDPVSLLVSGGDVGLAAVQNEVGTLVDTGLDEVENALVGLLGDEGTDAGLGVVVGTDSEGGGTLDQIVNPLVGLADHDDDGEGHAALTSGSEGGSDEGVESALAGSVRHDAAVVLGTHVGLDALAVGGGAVVDVLTDHVSSDEGDGTDIGVVAKEVNSTLGSVDHVEQTGLEQILTQLGHDGRRSGVQLGRLQDEGVTSGNGQGEGPEGQHGGEVEGKNSSNDSQRLVVRVNIDVGGNIVHGLSHHEGGSAAGMLNDLKSANNISTGIGGDLTALLANDGSNLVGVLGNAITVLEDLADTGSDGDTAPLLEGSLGGIRSQLHLGLSSLRDLTDELVGSLWMTGVLEERKTIPEPNKSERE